jgi:hypothetical protein
VRRIAAPTDFAVYDERVAIEVLERDPLFRWCQHRGCGAGQLAALGDVEPIMTCVRCGKEFCFVHRSRWHRGMTCAEYDAAPERAADACEEEERQDEEASSGKRYGFVGSSQVSRGTANY